MKNSTQKVAVILVVLVFSLSVSGSMLLAQEQGPGSLITASDQAFVKSNVNGSEKQVVAEAREAGSLITGADLSLIKSGPKVGSKRYPVPTGWQDADRNLKGTGVITEADYR